MSSKSPLSDRERANDLLRRKYAEEASHYDDEMGFWERRIFGLEHREWACSRAEGTSLEVAIGTGLNLPYYPDGVRLTGVDLSKEMLAVAGGRARELGVTVELKEGDAQELPFPDSSFDTVVCTYALCSVPDDALAIGEMRRVLRPGGRLILVDHVRSTFRPLLWSQKVYELIVSRRGGEYMTRRPALHVMGGDFVVEEVDRLRAGVVERLVATRPE